MTAVYRVGERVDGLYDENTDEMWYPGRIRSVHLSDGTFEVAYDDGEVEMNVRQEFLRQHVAGTICVGTRVLCRYDGGEEFYPGQVSDVQDDGRYTIAYDDGEVEEDVPLEHITEPTENDEGEEEPAKEEDEQASNNDMDGHQQQGYQEKMEDRVSDNKIEDNNREIQQENEENVHQDSELDKAPANSPAKRSCPAFPAASSYEESRRPNDQGEDHPNETPAGVSTERAYIIESLQLLEKRLGDAASTKSVLSTLVKQMRAYPQVTADLVHERGGERLLIDALKFHQSHAVIQCYGCVLLRRLCFLCVKSTHYLLHNGIVELVIQAMNAFAEDAILQASACGALAVFTRVHAGLNILIEFQVAQLVLSTLIYHKTYSVHTRQVHYYACEVLLELCELDDLQTLNLLCGEQEEDFTGDMSPISLLLFLLRQGLSLDDKKACCAVGSLLMCLAASGRRAAALILSLNGLAELSTVMARYPTEPSIQKYSAAASKQIALCSVRQSPTKRIKDTATEILREAESIENTPREPLPKKRTSRRPTNTGKRKSNSSTRYGAAANPPRGSAYNSYRGTQAFSKSPYGQIPSGFGDDMNSYNYPVSAPQQPSSLVILDGGIGLESGFGSANKYRRLSKEDRQSELFDAYGIHEIPNGRPHGTKRAQLRAHLASAETTWATPQHRISSSMKPYSSRSERLDHGHGWDFDTEEHPFEAEPRQPRGGKRKKKNPSARTAFQVKLENENQLRVSREARPPYPSPQRLGAATKRAAKARHKRIAATGHSSLTGKSSSTLSESLNEYATQLFQDNASRGGTQFPARSRLTPREKEEIRERERLSFAEKLHKMIDKAKSTLASSNTMDPVPIPPKSSKPARKTVPDRTRTLANTPKQGEKEVLSSEVVETRPAKPTSRANKRNEPSSVPVVPRPKPTIARSVVTPKSTDARTQGNKTTKAVPTKTTEKAQVEKPKEAVVKSTPAEAANILKADEPHPAEATEEVAVEEETKPTVPVEPEASNTGVAVEMEIDAIPPNATNELQTEPTLPKTQAVVSSDERRNEELPDLGVGVENAAMVKETETADTPISPPQAMEEDTTPELTTDAPSLSEETVDERQAPLEEPAALEPTVDLPSESSATVDAMYGDAFNDFDENGGEDEDMTVEAGADPDDTHTPATEASDPINNPMQESKSGEALYDDYDEFDEDEPPQDEDVEVEDTPVEDVAAEITALLSQTETEPDPVKNAPEGEEEVEAPAVAVAVAAEDTASVFSGCEDGANVDENGGGIDVEPLESEPGPGQESQPEVSSNGQTTEEAPSDIEPIVGSAEDQESVNLDVDSAPVPSDENVEEGGPYLIPVDDPDKIPVDDVAEGAPDGGTGEKVDTEPDGDAELDEAEVAAGNDGASAQLESEASEPKLPGKNVVSVDPTTIEATANPVQDEDDKTDSTAQQDVPQMSDEAVTSLEQDGEAKKLTTDSSVASVHSAAYDDDNFDDEAHNEAGLSEAVDTSAVEETVQVAEPRQEDESPDTTPNPAAVSTDPEDESKTLVANSSELSVQSAGYDDDGFEDGAQEDPQADTSEDRAPVQEPSGNEHTDSAAVDTPLERASEDKPISPHEDEVPGATTEIPKDEDIENTAADETPKETAPESVPEMVDVSSELKQPDPTTTSESEVVVAPSIEAENESPDSLAQDETTGNIQEPANVEAEKDEEAGQVDENAGGASEGDTVATTEPDETENIVTDPSAVPDTLEDETSETNATPAEDETSEIAIPTETVMAQTEAEAGEEPATYDDDNFADEEEVAPSVAHEEPDLVAKEAAGEGLKGEEPMIQSSEQPSVEIGESVAADINNEENTGQEGNDGMEELSHPKQPEDTAVDSSGEQDKPDDSVQCLTPEGAIPSENVEEAPAESEDVTSDVGDSVPAVKPSEVELTATPTEQPHDQNASVLPDENPETENSTDTPQVESIPDPEVESDAHAYSNDSVTASPESAATTGEIKEETSAESEPRPDDIRSVADIPPEPLVHDTQEAEYDAEFDDAENDAALDATPPKNEPIQDEGDTNEEATVEYEDAEFDDVESDATLAKDDKGPIQNEGDAKEVAAPEDNVNDTTKDEATGQPTDDPATETDTKNSGAADVDDSTSVNVDLEASNQADTEEETKDEADVDALQYEEDFPDAPSEIQDTEPISTKVEAPDSDNIGTEPETIAIESNPDNEPSSPNENASELAQQGDDAVAVPDPSMDNLYDDGFDDDNTAIAIHLSDSSNPIETSSPVDGSPVVNGDSDGLDNNAGAMQDEADVKVEESDAADTIEAQPTEALVLNEPIESESVKTETVEPVPMEPDTINSAPVEVEVNDSAPMESETAGTVLVEPPLEAGSALMEPEASTSTVKTNEAGVVELEPDAHRDEVVKPEVESGKADVVESEGVELGNTESQPPGPIEETLLSADPDAADPELVEPSPVESNSDAPAPKSQEEGKLADPPVDTPATLEAGEECFVSEPSEIPIPIEDSDTLPVVEVPVDAEQVTPKEGNDGTATGDAKEEAPQEEKPSIEEIVGDPLQSDKPAEDTTDSSVEAPPAEAPVEVATDEQLEPVQSDAEHTLEAGPLSSEDAYLSDDNPDDALNLVDPVSQEKQEVAVGSSSMGDADKVNGDPSEAPEPRAAIVEPSNAAQRAIEDQASDEPDYADDDETYEEQSPVQDKVSSQKDREVGAESPNDTAQVSENIAETSPSEAIETPTPTEVIEPSHKEQPTVEDEASDEHYAEDDVIEDESPVVVKDESNGNIGSLPPVSAVQGSVNVPELVIENESPEPDQTVAGSEAPKTEGQYDDDDGYNEFDDQEPPTVEVPAPSTATTKAPATEDEYDEYENDEYGEEEKPSKNEPEAVKSTRSSPPVSAREEEINEVADDPEEAEENAYADDQDEYEEDEVPASVPQSSSPPKQDNAVPKQAEAEASADEYEDDNEEEDYADDEIEDSSPPKPAPAVHPAKSDDEMEEELESEEDYASD